MSVLSDTANLELRRNNVEVLEEQLRQTRDRFNVGEVTRTDVAQSNSRLAQGRATLRSAESNLIGARERRVERYGSAPAAEARVDNLAAPDNDDRNDLDHPIPLVRRSTMPDTPARTPPLSGAARIN